MTRTDCPLVRSGRMRRPLLLAGPVVASLVVAVLGGVASAAESESPEAAQLRRSGISPDAAGVATFLANLNPSPQLQQRIDRLVTDLGSDDFAVREAASRDLSGIGAARPALT